MSFFDKSQTRKKTKRKTKATAKKMTMMTTTRPTTATQSERAPYLFRRVKDEERTFRQGSRGGPRLAPTRISQSHSECCGSGVPPTSHHRIRDSQGGCFWVSSMVPTTKKSIFKLPSGPDHIVLYQKNSEAVCSTRPKSANKSA